MSDFDDDISDEGDFSASEDEWKPNQNETIDTSEAEDSDFEEVQSSKAVDKTNEKKRKSIEQASQSTTKKVKVTKKSTTPSIKRNSQSLRSKMFNKYKPLPKTIGPSKPINKSLVEKLESSQYKKRKCLSSSRSESSESSVNDHLINPKDINLMSSYFDVNHEQQKNQSQEPPNFDCNAGMRLSDSEDEDNNDEIKDYDIPSTSKGISMEHKEQKDSTQSTFSHFDSFLKAQDIMKARAMTSKTETATTNENPNSDDIEKLLAMGEKPSSTSSKSSKQRKQHHHESESDWEEVQGDDEDGQQQAQHQSLMQNYKDGIQVTVEFPQFSKRKSDDIDATLKRRINRVIKENQIYLHKVSLLCHIAHGNYCNKVINNPYLMSEVLKLLPNTNCYPNGRTEIKYFESIIKWYKNVIQLKYDGMYCNFRKRPPLLKSLALQIKFKGAICKKDYVLIFVTLLRAMGIQCRLVMNLVTLPIRPPQDTLCSLKQKKTPTKTDNDNDDDDEKKSSKSKKNEKSSNKAKSSNQRKTKTKKYSSSESESDGDDEVFNDDDDEDENDKKELKQRPQRTKKTSPSNCNDKKLDTEKSSSSSKPRSTNAKDALEKFSSQGTKKKQIHIDKVETAKNDTEKNHESTKAHEKVKNSKSEPSNEKNLSKSTNSKIDDEKGLKTKAKKGGMNRENDKLILKVEESEEVTGRKTRSSSKIKDDPITKKEIKKEVKRRKTAVDTDDHEIQSTKRVSKNKSPYFDSNNESEKKTFIRLDLGKNKKCENKDTKGANTDEKKSKTPQSSGRGSSSKSKKLLNGNDENASSSKATNSKSTSSQVTRSQKAKDKKLLEVPQLDGSDDIVKTNKNKKSSASSVSTRNKTSGNDNNDSKKTTGKKKVNLKKLQVSKKNDSPSDSDDEFVPSPPKKIRKSNNLSSKLLERVKCTDRRVLSTDEENNGDNGSREDDEKIRNKRKTDMWVEVFSELEDQWITIDLFKLKVHCVESIRKSATSPVAYVFAWNNDNTLKDVSQRYCPQWNTTTRKLRIDQDWLDEALKNYVGKKTARDIAEDRELYRMHLEKPLPTTISEYKNHPLYVLERHLLKFEVIYPPNAVTLGFVRGEPVYARECVHVCHSRDIWLKSARVVKLGEKPYKIVKSRPKWDRMTQTVIKDQPLEIFGYWQTMPYDPPTAENGIVPRNAYGNVELFKKCMLPKKTVHLQLPGLNKICRKLNIDCAPAVIGFDFHQGVCHPMYDGFVVCEEYKDQVIEAWNTEKEEAERRETEKYLQRVYGNWKKLIRGLLIKQKLKLKYNF